MNPRTRQCLPLIPLSHQEPAIEIIPPRPDALDLAFSAAREAIQRLESRQLIHIGGEWSPSHFAKAS